MRGIVFAGAALLGLALPLFGGGKKDTAPPPVTEITVTGRVRLVGNEPFTELVITDGENRDWRLEGEDREKLSSLEQRTVTVTGTPEHRDIILANGQKAGVWNFLRNIRVVEGP